MNDNTQNQDLSFIEDAMQNELEEGKNGDKLEYLIKLTDELIKAEDNVKALELQLEGANKRLGMISRTLIPEVMGQLGMKSYTLRNGDTLKIEHGVDCSVKKENMSTFYDWLRKRGDDYIIKTSFQFGKMKKEDYQKVVYAVGETHVAFDVKEEINGNTQKAYFKNLLGVKLPESERLVAVAKGQCMNKDELPAFVSVFEYEQAKHEIPKR